MNPLVQSMLNTAAGQDTELVFLEGLLNDDCKCESETHDGGRVLCSGDVTYRLFTCEPAINVCTNMGKEALGCLGTRKYTCYDCGRDLEDCWTIRPI